MALLVLALLHKFWSVLAPHKKCACPSHNTSAVDASRVHVPHKHWAQALGYMCECTVMIVVQQGLLC